MMLTGEDRSTGRETFDSDTFCTTNLKQTDLLSNPILRCVRLETNRLSHDSQFSALHMSAYLAVYTSWLCYEDQIVYAHCYRQTDHIEYLMWAEC